MSLHWLNAWRAALRRRKRRRRLATLSVDYLADILIPDPNGGVLHVDYLLLVPRGLLLLDWREVRGNVFGSDAMLEWTVMDGPRRFTFANPQAGLYDRLAALRAIAGAVPVDARIVFADTATFPKGLPRLTWRESDLQPEFLLGDRLHAEQIVSPWRAEWARLSIALAPSQFSAH